MIDLRNVRSLSDFQRNTKSHLRRLKQTGKPEVLTVNGQAEIIVQDASSYQELLDALEQAETLAGIRRGLDQANRGEGRSMRQAIEDIATRAGISLDE
jgi:PHD/YefM family antitoxin component YafN of YafNO toxin-antitoxin module